MGRKTAVIIQGDHEAAMIAADPLDPAGEGIFHALPYGKSGDSDLMRRAQLALQAIFQNKVLLLQRDQVPEHIICLDNKTVFLKAFCPPTLAATMIDRSCVHKKSFV
jgi:hypothetical protein